MGFLLTTPLMSMRDDPLQVATGGRPLRLVWLAQAALIALRPFPRRPD